MSLQIIQGDALAVLTTMLGNSVQCCVTSPPYWGLRDYGVDGQMGLEKTPEEYVGKMVEVFREVRRVLRKDGTCWVNLGDAYNGSGNPAGCKGRRCDGGQSAAAEQSNQLAFRGNGIKVPGLKPKDLCGIPWRVAFALQADGWWLRQDIIWQKPNPMPESVTDRCTKSHEYIFLLTKSARYFYDAEAVKEASTVDDIRGPQTFGKATDGSRDMHRDNGRFYEPSGNGTRNKRSVWTVPSAPYSEAHFATFPPDLITPCILAGSKPGDTILDPFGGSGTTGMVALELGRKAILIELNPNYVQLIRDRTNVTPGLALA
jgi:DNA modification methylase